MNVASNDPAATLRQAFDCARVGQLQRAAALCAEVLRRNGEHAEAWLLRAVIALQTGDAAAAAAAARRSIQSAPPRGGAAHALLGDALLTLRQPLEALENYDAALRRDPNLASAHCGRGSALLDLRRPREALASFDEVLRAQPNDAEVLFNRGVALFDLGDFAAAVESFDRAIAARPSYAAALTNRGSALLSLQKTEPALASFDAALAIEPAFAVALRHRAVALRLLGWRQEALQSFDRALLAEPAADAWVGRGEVLLELDRFEEALASFERALELRPDCAPAHNGRGNCLRALGRHAAAVSAYRQSLALDPDSAAVHCNLAHALVQAEDPGEEALASYSRALALDPDTAYAAGPLLFARRGRADWGAAVPAASDEGVARAVLAGKPACAPFAFLSIRDSPSAQLVCARTFTERTTRLEPRQVRQVRRQGHERIRIAYVSADLREHPVSYLLVGALERHDRRRFETYAVSLRPAEASTVGDRVKNAFDRFLDVSASPDREVSELMRELEVDIAVDLTGFTRGFRPQIFAQGAAPIQVNYLGYPGTMGAPFIDYLIADEFVIPPEQRQHYSEAIVYLPDCFQANDDRRTVGDGGGADRGLARTAAGLPEKALVLCCANDVHKINPPMFDIWMRLLAQLPAGVLWLLGVEPVAQDRLRREARARGIDAHRLVFAGRVSYPAHLERLRLADLMLDTLPFNAGATASDALWVGVPLLTWAGEAFAARMAGSLLRAAGVPELITFSAEEYESAALELARSPEKLCRLKRRLAENRSTMPLFDTPRFTRHLEAAFEQMWMRHESGLAPSGFSVRRD